MLYFYFMFSIQWKQEERQRKKPDQFISKTISRFQLRRAYIIYPLKLEQLLHIIWPRSETSSPVEIPPSPMDSSLHQMASVCLFFCRSVSTTIFTITMYWVDLFQKPMTKEPEKNYTYKTMTQDTVSLISSWFIVCLDSGIND